ncbi:MAG: hypothetical protein H7Y86_09260 [Rhizobacter sp.]|nr:hypothetical protein [Ferruginibacter sp.]
MLSEIISANINAPVIVIFGGSPIRREEVLKLIESIEIEITAYGVLSEEEGLEMLQTLPHVNLVLIGGRYTTDQRFRIKNFLIKLMPKALITEPGWDYPYNNDNIKEDVIKKLAATKL